MRKFIFIFMAIVTLVLTSACTSCNNNGEGFGIQYSLQSEGKTDGFVEVAFINGNFKINGDASYLFSLTSEPQTFKAVSQGVKLDEALRSGNTEIIKSAEYVNNWLEESIKVSDFEGHYDVYVRGYVKETLTQITFSIDRHFTNIPEDSPEPEEK